jgi:hypothetical protein
MSRLLWTSLPFIAANIFVWRLLFPLMLLLVIIVAASLSALPEKLASPGLHAIVACVATVQATAFVLWHTSSDISVRRVTQQEIEQGLAVESRRTQGWGIDEYRPNPRTVPTLTESCRDVGSVDSDGGSTMRFAIGADDAYHCIHVGRFWNVRFAASIDGHATPVYADRDGEIAIAPRGRAGVATIRYEQPRYALASMLVSAIATLLFMIVAGAPRQGNFGGKGSGTHTGRP